MVMWQVGVWLFGLFVVVMMVAARSDKRISSVGEYMQVRPTPW
jgi:hypothetical protein